MSGDLPCRAVYLCAMLAGRLKMLRRAGGTAATAAPPHRHLVIAACCIANQQRIRIANVRQGQELCLLSRCTSARLKQHAHTIKNAIPSTFQQKVMDAFDTACKAHVSQPGTTHLPQCGDMGMRRPTMMASSWLLGVMSASMDCVLQNAWSNIMASVKLACSSSEQLQ